MSGASSNGSPGVLDENAKNSMTSVAEVVGSYYRGLVGSGLAACTAERLTLAFQERLILSMMGLFASEVAAEEEKK